MTANAAAAAERPAGIRPAARRWAVRLLLSQAAAFVVLTLLLVYAGQRDPTAWISLPIACYTALTSVLLFAVGAWLRRSGWARGPGVVLEVLQVLTGCWAWLAGGRLIGGPMVVLGLTVIVCLLVPYREQTDASRAGS